MISKIDRKLSYVRQRRRQRTVWSTTTQRAFRILLFARRPVAVSWGRHRSDNAHRTSQDSGCSSHWPPFQRRIACVTQQQRRHSAVRMRPPLLCLLGDRSELLMFAVAREWGGKAARWTAVGVFSLSKIPYVFIRMFLTWALHLKSIRHVHLVSTKNTFWNFVVCWIIYLSVW